MRGPEPLENLQSVEPRHCDVEEEQLGTLFRNHGQRLVAVCRLSREAQPAVALERELQQRADLVAVVRDHDPDALTLPTIHLLRLLAFACRPPERQVLPDLTIRVSHYLTLLVKRCRRRRGARWRAARRRRRPGRRTNPAGARRRPQSPAGRRDSRATPRPGRETRRCAA